MRDVQRERRASPILLPCIPGTGMFSVQDGPKCHTVFELQDLRPSGFAVKDLGFRRRAPYCVVEIGYHRNSNAMIDQDPTTSRPPFVT